MCLRRRYKKKDIIGMPLAPQMVLKLPQGHEDSEYVLSFEIGQREGGFYSGRTDRTTQYRISTQIVYLSTQFQCFLACRSICLQGPYNDVCNVNKQYYCKKICSVLYAVYELYSLLVLIFISNKVNFLNNIVKIMRRAQPNALLQCF